MYIYICIYIVYIYILCDMIELDGILGLPSLGSHGTWQPTIISVANPPIVYP